MSFVGQCLKNTHVELFTCIQKQKLVDLEVSTIASVNSSWFFFFFFAFVAALIFFWLACICFSLYYVIALVLPNFKWQQIPVWCLPSWVDQLLQFFHIQSGSEKTINGPVSYLCWKKRKQLLRWVSALIVFVVCRFPIGHVWFFQCR